MAGNQKQSSSQMVKPKRLFSPDDEIILVNGLLDFKSRTGIDPTKILNVFYNAHKHSVSVKTTTQKQFRDKICKLKQKYKENLKKKKQGSLIFADRHEENLFELSNEFWGGENGADNMRMNVLKRAELDRRCVQLKVQEEKLRLQRALLVEEHV
ncbi:mediator of RNA polymerase II transcription subunit, partial [Trifolium medium]|nr:mediator of RNA polymerase II transcription subunit [Trifolium medium]